jgi:hypothetical protein
LTKRGLSRRRFRMGWDDLGCFRPFDVRIWYVSTSSSESFPEQRPDRFGDIHFRTRAVYWKQRTWRFLHLVLTIQNTGFSIFFSAHGSSEAQTEHTNLRVRVRVLSVSTRHSGSPCRIGIDQLTPLQLTPPLEHLVGVHSVSPRHQRLTCARFERQLRDPPLLSYRSPSPCATRLSPTL